MTTATIVHTSSREIENSVRIARVAAAGRVAAQRQAAAARAERERRDLHALVAQWVEDVKALGAVRIGVKICLAEGGKWRLFVEVDTAAWFLTRQILSEDSVEASGQTAEGEFVGTPL